jgi:hypothetical protein
MAFSDYSTDPNANVTIGGINVAEGALAAGINNAIRIIMADGKALSNSIPATSSFATKAAAVFEGTQPKYLAEGALMHWKDPSLVSGEVHHATFGTTPPTLGEGDWFLEY